MKQAILLLLFPLLPLYAGAAAPAEVQALVDSARGAPAEFAADTLIRVAGLDKLDKAYRVELLDFDVAQIQVTADALILTVDFKVGVQ